VCVCIFLGHHYSAAAAATTTTTTTTTTNDDIINSFIKVLHNSQKANYMQPLKGECEKVSTCVKQHPKRLERKVIHLNSKTVKE